MDLNCQTTLTLDNQWVVVFYSTGDAVVCKLSQVNSSSFEVS
jgi:hypothetical protein